PRGTGGRREPTRGWNGLARGNGGIVEMKRSWKTSALALVLAVAAAAATVAGMAGEVLAREKVRIAFIGPLSGGNARIGLGGRNSAMLAIQEANADPSLRYEYELVLLDDECLPQSGVQAALKAGSDRSVVAA